VRLLRLIFQRILSVEADLMSRATIRPRSVLAVTFAVVGVALAFRALSRNLPASTPVEGGATASAGDPSDTATRSSNEPSWTEWYVPAAMMRFEVDPTAQTVESVASLAATRVREEAEALPQDQSVDSHRLQRLIDRFERHFRIIIAADYDGWLDQVRLLGGSPGKIGTAEVISRERFTAQADAFRLVPLSLESLRLRPLMINGRTIDYGPRPNIWGHALYRGDYGVPSDPEAASLDIYEILIPMQMRVTSGTDKPMNVGFSYFWSAERDTWVPYELQFYTDQGGQFTMFVF